MKAFDRTLVGTEDLLHAIGCCALVLIAVLINGDILTRFFAGRSQGLQFELTELYLMPALATLSLSRLFRRGGHLALEVDTPRLLGRAWPVARVLILGLSAGFFATVAWVSGRYAFHAFAHNDIQFGLHDWPLGWSYLPVPLGTGVLTLRLIREIIRRDAQSVPDTSKGGDIHEPV
ncbi:TRAP transporter small permease [Salipiger sp.]|uniref:TRAP transporter small permease n=1 Tax=Salipiger sp. TaxID=2078585 RepID=UPI003A973A17